MTNPQVTGAMLDLIRQQAAAELRELPVFCVGDQVRVIADSRAGPKAPHIGDIGIVVAVYAKSEVQLVYHNMVDRAYLLDFGSGEDRGRDTWAYADGDVQAADLPWPRGHKRRT